MTAFPYYRLPYLHHAHYVAQRVGEPEVSLLGGGAEWQGGLCDSSFLAVRRLPCAADSSG